MIRPRKGATHLVGIGRIKTIRHRLGLPRRIGTVLLDAHEHALHLRIPFQQHRIRIACRLQQVLCEPVVRNGKKATVGYQPDVWKGWE